MDQLPTIIIPAYKRSKALDRLLCSINNACYPFGNINLIISLDGRADKETVCVAQKFTFHHGPKELVEREQNIGLKEHILWCGDQSMRCGAVIVLEDDLLVDPYYYLYAIQALNFFYTDQNIAGFALYSPCRNEYVNLPFEPMQNGSAAYPSQVPCSWGQVWTKQQWEKFRKWYENKTHDVVQNCSALPDAVKKWPESSWKKYFAAYLVLEDLYFIYPYISYTTNCSDPGGTHIVDGTDEHHVAMSCPQRRAMENISFLLPSDSTVSYDSFFEPHAYSFQQSIPHLSDKEFEVDLYASKPIEFLRTKKYTITTKEVNNPIVAYSLVYRPIEINLYHSSQSESFLFAYLAESKYLSKQDGSAAYANLMFFYSNICLVSLREEHRKKFMEEIENSLSWKITKPLRTIGEFYIKMSRKSRKDRDA
ncbi:Glycosyl transferase family 2 [Candidatus Electrothrix aarhusensis]|uniref:Glycosyl transferase family 2 n=1 Tax=Candidatus Electrothrix aarhusensis TaxID=1859131 RepID=A0A444J0W1_9BACT|nr:Glycosyl transferase family 2 [Candidatus Electrothrix aarhusensis]